MAFCKSCGKPIEDNVRVCTACGADQSVGGTSNQPFDPAKDVADNKGMAILAYIGFLALIPYFAAKDSPFARYHAIQGINLLIYEAIASVAISIIATILSFTIVLIFLAVILWILLAGLIITLSVLGIINAFKGEIKPLPFIDNYKIVKN